MFDNKNYDFVFRLTKRDERVNYGLSDAQMKRIYNG